MERALFDKNCPVFSLADKQFLLKLNNFSLPLLKNDISERSFAKKSESIENSRYQAFRKQGGTIFFIYQNDDEASIFHLVEGITFFSELLLTN